MNKNKQAIIEHTISLYSGTGWKRVFAKGRFWYAPYIEVEQLLPKGGKIIDLGCGEGVLTNYLGLSSPDREVLGIDVDQNRIKQANHGVKNVSFTSADITKFKIPPCDGIVIFQVLHHLHSAKEQEEIIQHCVKNLKKNGKLIIVEIYVGLSLNYFLTWIADHLLVAWFFEKRLYSPILFRKLADWKKVIESHDLSYKVINPNSITKPFSNTILECTKK